MNSRRSGSRKNVRRTFSLIGAEKNWPRICAKERESEQGLATAG
jgi:hypothetical protein